jgi:hypothetical protein
VSIVDMSQSKNDFGRSRMNYGIYALWLKNGVGCSLKYGRRHYDYDEGTVVSFAPGQMVQAEPTNTDAMPQSIGLLFHPDLYDEAAMTPELRRAHQENDRAVMAAFGFDIKMSESECVAELFRMYQGMVGNQY